MSATRKKNTGHGPSKKARHGTKTRKSSARPDEMSAEVIEFITAIDEYKRLNHRPFPSWSEVLEIVKGLGYEKPEDEA